MYRLFMNINYSAQILNFIIQDLISKFLYNGSLYSEWLKNAPTLDPYAT